MGLVPTSVPIARAMSINDDNYSRHITAVELVLINLSNYMGSIPRHATSFQ